MKTIILIAVGAFVGGIALATPSQAQEAPVFQPVYTVPLVQLDDNGRNLVQEAGFRGRGFRGRGFRSRGFHRGFKRGFHKRRSFHGSHRYRKFGKFHHRKFRKF
ncbi:MAG: hypothetical protein AAF423_10265 [Pseudomonadota bacterium]